MSETEQPSFRERFDFAKNFKNNPPKGTELYVAGLIAGMVKGKAFEQSCADARADVEGSRQFDSTYEETLKILNSAIKYLKNEGFK